MRRRAIKTAAPAVRLIINQPAEMMMPAIAPIPSQSLAPTKVMYRASRSRGGNSATATSARRGRDFDSAGANAPNIAAAQPMTSKNITATSLNRKLPEPRNDIVQGSICNVRFPPIADIGRVLSM